MHCFGRLFVFCFVGFFWLVVCLFLYICCYVFILEKARPQISSLIEGHTNGELALVKLEIRCMLNKSDFLKLRGSFLLAHIIQNIPLNDNSVIIV